MSNKKTYKLPGAIDRVNLWIIVICLVVSCLMAIVALRNNNLQMIKLREEVVKADESDGDVNTALNNLRQYVYRHMNTDLTSGNGAIKPPIQLKNTYERLVTAEKNETAEFNKKVNADATVECERNFPAGQLDARVKCVQDHITSNSQKEQQIPKELYQFDFISPVWSPDFAGWALVVTAGLLMLLAFKISTNLWFKHRLDV